MKRKVSDLEIGDKLTIYDHQYIFKRWVNKRLRRIGLTAFREFVSTSEKGKIQLMSCNLDDVAVSELSAGEFIYQGA